MEKRSKRRSLLSTFAVLCVMLVMICAVTIPGIYAKYSSKATGTDSAEVAKWSFMVSGEEIAVTGATPTVDFKLFETINDTDPTKAETDVAPTKIAPGTSGKFNLKVHNTSDVKVNYSIAFEVTATVGSETIPLKFKVGETGEWKNELTNIAATELAVGSAEVTIPVEWKWEYTGNDNDTAIGIAARGETKPEATVKATITAEQVD